MKIEETKNRTQREPIDFDSIRAFKKKVMNWLIVSIYIRCGVGYLSEKISLEALAKFSPKSVCDIKLIGKMI